MRENLLIVFLSLFLFFPRVLEQAVAAKLRPHIQTTTKKESRNKRRRFRKTWVEREREMIVEVEKGGGTLIKTKHLESHKGGEVKNSKKPNQTARVVNKAT